MSAVFDPSEHPKFPDVYAEKILGAVEHLNERCTPGSRAYLDQWKTSFRELLKAMDVEPDSATVCALVLFLDNWLDFAMADKRVEERSGIFVGALLAGIAEVSLTEGSELDFEA